MAGVHLVQFGDHYWGLMVGYATAMCAWAAQSRVCRRLWPASAGPTFARPGIELGFAGLALLGIILLGMLYGAGICLPSRGPLGPVLESLNHIIIFSPMIAMLFWRKQSAASAWLPTDRVRTRLAVGVISAIAGLAMFSLVRTGADPFWQVLPRLVRYNHLPHFVQVFLEDVSIAVLFVRLSALLRREWLLAIIVGGLFSAAHAPTLFVQGVGLSEMGYLLADFVLGTGIVFVLQRSRDIWWFFPVHFVMDMTQFSPVSGAV
jgi:hypothetical protein